MRTILPGLIFLCLLLPTPLAAETYSCTDNTGKIHIADTLMKLPAECRDRAKTHEDKDSGRVNYVPSPEVPASQNQRFRESVRMEEAAQQKKEREATELVQRAETLAKSFEDAVNLRKKAVRSKSYGNRDKIRAAEAMMEFSRKEKQTILEEMQSIRLSAEQRQQIMAALEQIAD